MSFDSLVESQPPVNVMRLPDPQESDSAGFPAVTSGDLAKVVTIRGRFSRPNARQESYWASLGIEVDYVFITKYNHIRNGDVLQVVDSKYENLTRTFRVVGGVSGAWFGEGNIESYTSYPVKQTVITGGTAG